MKAYKSPPDAVKNVAEAVCLLFAKEPNYQNFLKLIVDYTFVKAMVNYDTSRVSDYALTRLSKYVENENFTPEYVAKISVGASFLCAWVISIYRTGMLRNNADNVGTFTTKPKIEQKYT